MVGETQMSTIFPHADVSDSPPSNERGLGTLFHDLLTLAELQGRLFVHDLNTIRTGTGPAMLMIALGMLLGFSSIPILMFAFGWAIVAVWNVPVWAALAGVSLVIGVIPSLALLIIGWKTLRLRSRVLNRSAGEFQSNIAWLKRRLKQSF